jgi:zinc transporter ZupT
MLQLIPLVFVFITVIISGSLLLFLKISSNVLKLILAFSGAFILGITVLHLIPETYTNASITTGIFVLAGFMLQILIEYFSEGIEHGHVHHHHHNESNFPVTMLLALSIHSFIEGIPIPFSTDNALVSGIILHNIPIAIALMSVLLHAGLTKIKAALWLTIFACMTPLGSIAAYLLNDKISFIAEHGNLLLAIVIGIFLHVSTTILFESSENHRFNFKKLIVTVSGFLLATWLCYSVAG